jgi:hypothetical protein
MRVELWSTSITSPLQFMLGNNVAVKHGNTLQGACYFAQPALNLEPARDFEVCRIKGTLVELR